MAFTIRGIGLFCGEIYSLYSFPIVSAYLLMVCFSGVWQRYTKPLNLRSILIVYNMFCGVVSVYTSAGFIYVMATMDKNLHAYRPVEALRPFMILYWQTKIVELLDTVFMILRHRSRQVSFLHVYHHATMLLLTDYTCHNTPWPAICFMYCINSIVHIFLYFYYGITAWYPNYNIPWKHKLTEIQLTQFAIDLVFAIIGYLYHGFCVYILIYLFTMTVLFSNFYIKAYLKKGAKGKIAKDAANGSVKSSSGKTEIANGYHKDDTNGVMKHEMNGNLTHRSRSKSKRK